MSTIWSYAHAHLTVSCRCTSRHVCKELEPGLPKKSCWNSQEGREEMRDGSSCLQAAGNVAEVW